MQGPHFNQGADPAVAVAEPSKPSLFSPTVEASFLSFWPIKRPIIA